MLMRNTRLLVCIFCISVFPLRENNHALAAGKDNTEDQILTMGCLFNLFNTKVFLTYTNDATVLLVVANLTIDQVVIHYIDK
ncbi:hypothetical protein ABF87_02380 [Nitrosomonas sp. JL21]|nr:hypothetical protein [Nitrosomonas sp. JL21]